MNLMARCLCGGVEIEIDGKLGPLYYCHCKRCQRASGSAFSANCSVRTKYWSWRSGEALVREFDSSPGVWRAFCSRCGSPIYSRWADQPDMLRLRLGLLEGDPGRRPLAHFHTGSQAPWYEIHDDLPRHPAGPGPERDQPD
jgi:hypothetical protein